MTGGVAIIAAIGWIAIATVCGGILGRYGVLFIVSVGEWIAAKFGKDASHALTYGDVAFIPQELRSSGPKGSRGGLGYTEHSRPTDTHTQDVRTRHENSRLTRVRTDFPRRFPFWDTSL